MTTREGDVPDGTRHTDLVYLVAKAPLPGQVKSRLCPPLTPEQAARLAGAFLQDTLALATQAGVDVRLICRDESERSVLSRYASGVPVHVQDGDGLGAAMETAFERGLADGYRAVAVMGVDTPALPPSTLTWAFSLLEGPRDVAIGPSDDGGYYLLAAQCPHPALFQDMTWSTGDVVTETLRRCDVLGLRARLVTQWNDVDDAASLDALRAHLAGAPEDVAPHTRALLKQIG